MAKLTTYVRGHYRRARQTGKTTYVRQATRRKKYW